MRLELEIENDIASQNRPRAGLSLPARHFPLRIEKSPDLTVQNDQRSSRRSQGRSFFRS